MTTSSPVAIRSIGLVRQLGAYTIVSAVALACDFAFYLALVWLSVHASLAGAIGYSIGLVVQFMLSTRFVFVGSGTGKTQTRLTLEYAASAIVGLGLTATIIAITTQWLGIDAVSAKVIAVIVSFLAVFLMRRFWIFGARAGAPAASAS